MERRFAPGFIATEAQGAEIRVLPRKRAGGWEALYSPAPEAVSIAKTINTGFVLPTKPVLLASGDRKGSRVSLYPHTLDATSSRFLAPRYAKLRRITLVGFGFLNEIDSLESLQDFLSGLPAGLVRDIYYGLGVAFDIRQIISTVEELDVTDLNIIKGESRSPCLSGKTYEMPSEVFDSLRRDIGRIHNKALEVAREEKSARAHERLLTPIDDQKFPALGRPYEPGAIVKAVGDGLKRGIKFSAADAATLVKATASVIGEVGEREPSQLLKLTEAVETVTLQSMIANMRVRINCSYREEDWQKFLVANAFILRLAFGVPVLLFQAQATVGGRAYGGAGDKRADFLLQAAKTGNLSIVEIKTPQTELLTIREYRGGIFSPHPNLTSAVAQVLDQRWHLQQNNRVLADDHRRQNTGGAGGLGPEVYAVQCVIVAGQSPREPNHQKSFELYRNSLSGVLILTYDELVLKLETLLNLLNDPQATEIKMPTVTVKKPHMPKR